MKNVYEDVEYIPASGLFFLKGQRSTTYATINEALDAFNRESKAERFARRNRASKQRTQQPSFRNRETRG